LSENGDLGELPVRRIPSKNLSGKKDRLSFTLRTLEAAAVWPIEGRAKGPEKLASLIPKDLFELSTLTGHFPEISTRSQVPIALPPLAEQRRIVAGLDPLQAEVDALKRLQAESRHRLHQRLDALLPVLLLSSPGFDPAGDRAFKGEL
jgi:hypothetical protein